MYIMQPSLMLALHGPRAFSLVQKALHPTKVTDRHLNTFIGDAKQNPRNFASRLGAYGTESNAKSDLGTHYAYGAVSLVSLRIQYFERS
jgi:hypothetical protein